MSGMRVIGCQLDTAWENPEANHAKVQAMLQGAKLQGGELIVLPEMFATGFTMNVVGAADREGKTARFLSTLAGQYRATVIAGVVGVGASDMGRNEALMFDPAGNEIARYCKLHPFSIGSETKYYEPGEMVVTFALGGFTVSPFVCYDLRFPEIFRSAAQAGASLMAVIANWPGKRVEHWITLLKARAIENQAYVVGVNRCGSDPNHSYPGRSMIVDPHGVVLADAGESEGFIEAELDPEVVLRWRKEFPVLRDARKDFQP
jgi:omega-amidase